jgi:hypothetical protein
MATISVGDLKQIWQTVSNWVNGTDNLSKPKVTIVGSSTLSGKLANVTTAGIKLQLANISCREVTVIARKGNTGSIYVGGNDVSSTLFGVELEANESFTFSVSNANLIYIDSSVSGEGISYVTI